MKGSFLVVLITCVLATSVWADVIPTRLPESKPTGDRQVVTQRMEQLGIHGALIASQVDSMTDRDLAYFAQAPGRLALAGQDDKKNENEFESPTTEQIIVGAIWIAVGAAAIAVPFAVNSGK